MPEATSNIVSEDKNSMTFVSFSLFIKINYLSKIKEKFRITSYNVCYTKLLRWPQFKKVAQEQAFLSESGSVYCPDTTSVSRIFSSSLTYYKGAMILHTLRHELGDAAFFAGIKAYISDPSIQYTNSTAQQFKTHMETACGYSLNRFFDDCVITSYSIHYTKLYDEKGRITQFVP